MLRRIFSHSFYYSIAPICIQVLSLAILPLLTPHLSAFDFGIYGIITSYLFFITAIKDLGFNVVFVNTFYKHPKRWPLLWRMFAGHLLYWSIIYFFLQAAILYLAMPKTEMHNFPLILLLTAMPAVIFDTVSMLGNYYFRFSERPVPIALITLTGGIVSLCLTYYCIVILRMGYMGWFVANFSSAIIMFLCFLYPVFFKLKLVPILRFRKKFILRYLKISLPVIPHNYSSYLLNSSDRVIMNLLRININQIGLYNVAYRFGNYLEVAGEAMGMAVGPQYVKLYTENSLKSLRLARNLSFFFMTFFLCVAFTISLWLKEIFLVLFRNPELQTAYSLGIIIVMSYTYRPMYWSSLIRLSTSENTSSLWKVTFIGGVLNILLNLIFLRQYGIFAAAIVTFVSLLYVGFAGFYLPAYRRLKTLNHYPPLWILSIILLTIVAYYLRDFYWTYKIIFTAVLFIALIAIIKLLQQKRHDLAISTSLELPQAKPEEVCAE
jgi:O-antigen/teichoic acid export membrane protein